MVAGSPCQRRGITQVSGARGEGEDRLPNEQAGKIGAPSPILFSVYGAGCEGDAVFREIFDARRRHSFCNRKIGILAVNLRDLPGG